MDSGIFTIKDEEYLINQRVAGKILSSAFNEVKKSIIEGITSNSLNNIIESFILDNGCECTFKGYNGFPAATCISINKVVVHGIPDDYVLQYGDVVKIDSGATYKGAIADSAFTTIIGENSKYRLLMDTCKKTLDDVIESINCNTRIGDIGNIIEKHAKSINAVPVRMLTGHGLEMNKPHSYPIIYNFGQKGEGVKLLPGTTICIEPIMCYGNDELKILDDKWSIELNDIGVHFEHTLFIHKDRVEVIT